MTNYFSNVNSLSDLKSQFRNLALKHHPDRGGDTAIMQEINRQYEMAFPIWKHKSGDASPETAASTRHEFYTEFGYKGRNYDRSLYAKDLNIIFRKFLKTAFPTCRFSVSKTSGGSSIYICLMEAPFNPFRTLPDMMADRSFGWGKHGTYEQVLEDAKRTVNRGCTEINRHRIADDHIIADQAKKMFTIINEFVLSYHYNDSDARMDYFNTNFYYHLKIGKWNAPFKVVDRKPTPAQQKQGIIIA